MKKTLCLIAVLISVLGAGRPLEVFGVGQMTEPIIIQNAKQGENFEETLYLFNTSSIEDTFQITAEGDIANWVKFYDPKNPELFIEEIIIPPSSRYDLIAKFEIPEGMPNETYIGAISVSTSPKDGEKEENVSTSLIQKVDREVEITVTDKEEINLATSIIPKTYNLKSGDPLSFRIIYDNQSNIKVRPQIQLKLKKDEETVHNAIYPYPEETESVNSFSMKEIVPLEIQTTGLEDGKYLAEIKIIVNEKNKYDEKFSFRIGEIVDNENNFGFLSFVSRIGGGSLTLGWILIGGFIILLAVLITAIRKKRSFKKLGLEDEEI